jgi:hypothetical protein
MWFGKGVVNAGDDDEKPCEDGQDLVCPDGLNRVRLSASERIS